MYKPFRKKFYAQVVWLQQTKVKKKCRWSPKDGKYYTKTDTASVLGKKIGYVYRWCITC
jgi:hypothetical protein